MREIVVRDSMGRKCRRRQPYRRSQYRQRTGIALCGSSSSFLSSSRHGSSMQAEGGLPSFPARGWLTPPCC